MRIAKYFTGILAAATIVLSACDSSGGSESVRVKGVNITTSDFTLTSAGETKTVEWQITPSDAGNKSTGWISRDTRVATVDQSGKVAAVANGKTYIVISTVDGNKRDSVLVSVTLAKPLKPVSGVSISPAGIAMYIGYTSLLTAVIEPEDATNKDVKWSSNATATASVDNKGLVGSLTLGEAQITATTVDGELKASTKVKIAPKNVSGTYFGNLEGSTKAIPLLGVESMKISQSGEMEVVQISEIKGTFKINQTVENIAINEDIDCGLTYVATECKISGTEEFQTTIPENKFGLPAGAYDVEVTLGGAIDANGNAKVDVKIRLKIIVLGTTLWQEVFNGILTGTKK